MRNHADTMDYLRQVHVTRLEHLPPAERERALLQLLDAMAYVKHWAQRVGADERTYHDMLECLGLRPYPAVRRPSKV